MRERKLDRRLVLAGIGAAILGVLGSLVYGDTPDFVNDPAAIKACSSSLTALAPDLQPKLPAQADRPGLRHRLFRF